MLAIVWLDKRPVLCGLALAMGISVKFVPVVAVPYLLFRRRWIAAASTIVGCVLMAALPAISIGWSNNIRYLAMADAGLARILGVTPAGSTAKIHSLADPLNISVTSALARLVEANHWPNGCALIMTGAVFLLWLAPIVLQYRRRHIPLFRWPPPRLQEMPPFRGLIAIEWAALVTAAMEFSPNSIFLLSIFPAVVMASLLLPTLPKLPSATLLAGIILMFIALLFPIAGMGHSLTKIWNSTAASSCLLLIACLFLYSGAWSSHYSIRRAR